MYRRWSGRYHFRWTPRIGFERRRLDLLTWLETNVDPIGFVVTEDSVGVALGTTDLRLVITKGGLTLVTGASGAPVDALLHAVDGVFDVLQPSSPRGVQGLFKTTYVLPESHLEACARLGRQTSFADPAQAWTPSDSSVLVDFVSEDAGAQVEWGVVSAAELLERLAGNLGRMKHRAPDDTRLNSVPNDGEVPAVSLFAEVMVTPNEPQLAETANAVLATALQWESMVQDLTTNLYTSFASRDRKSA